MTPYGSTFRLRRSYRPTILILVVCTACLAFARVCRSDQGRTAADDRTVWSPDSGSTLASRTVVPPPLRLDWTYSVPADGSLSNVVIGEGRMYVTTRTFLAGGTSPNQSNMHLLELDPATGKVLWKVDFDEGLATGLLMVAAGRVYFTTESPLNLEPRRPSWRLKSRPAASSAARSP